MLRRGPGLARMAVGTAVVAGTAGAVRHHQEQKYYNQAQQQAEAQAYEQQQTMAAQAPQPAPAAAPAPSDMTAQLTQLAQLKDAGILTEEEFEAKKKQILGI